MSFGLRNTYIASQAQNPEGLQLLAEASLSGAAASLTVSSIPAKDTLLFEIWVDGMSGADTMGMRFNGDTGNTYCYRNSLDSANSSAHTQSGIRIDASSGTWPRYISGFTSNIAAMYKRPVSSCAAGGGGGFAPSLTVCAGVWENGAAQISSITIYGIGGNNLSADSFIKVYGAD